MDEKVRFIFILRSGFLKIKRKFKPPFTDTLPISHILQPPYTPRLKQDNNHLNTIRKIIFKNRCASVGGSVLRSSISSVFRAGFSMILIMLYPPGSKCEALRLGVHLILLSFIWISLLILKIFVLFFGCGCGCWCGWGTFLSLNFLIIIWYIV